MAQRLFYHLVWTTRDRAPLIDAGLAAFLVQFLRATASREHAELVEIGIVSTHVHVLLSARQTTALPRLVQLLKGASSNIARKEGHSSTGSELRWAQGYHLDSVSPRQLETVRAYVRQPPRRHPSQAIPGWLFDPGSTRPQDMSMGYANSAAPPIRAPSGARAEEQGFVDSEMHSAVRSVHPDWLKLAAGRRVDRSNTPINGNKTKAESDRIRAPSGARAEPRL